MKMKENRNIPIMCVLVLGLFVAPCFADVNLSSYASLSAALTAIGSSDVTLLIDSSETILSNTTIPSNVGTKFVKGQKFTINSGITLTISGPIDAGVSWYIFAGTGDVAFSMSSKNATEGMRLSPIWFGAVGDGSTDDSAAFNRMISAAQSGSVINLQNLSYKFNLLVTIDKTLELIGSNNDPGTSWATFDVSAGNYIKTAATGIIFKGIRFYNSAGTSGSGRFADSTASCAEMRFISCKFDGVALGYSGTGTGNRIKVINCEIYNSPYDGIRFVNVQQGQIIGCRIDNSTCKDHLLAFCTTAIMLGFHSALYIVMQ